MLLIYSSTDSHNTYGSYLAEILRGEGFVDFEEADLSALDRTVLARHDLLILSRLTPTRTQATILADYVGQGGRLIAFLPDRYLVSLLGMRPTFRGIDNGYLRMDPADLALQGLCAEPIQVIVPAIEWTQQEEGARARVMARIYHRRESAGQESIPGVVWSRVGQGETVLFAYDLPHAVARLRHGNPAHADLCFAGLDGRFRPSELFVGQLDPEQMLLPQADLHTTLLARLIETMAPRPRLWYYPKAEQRSVMVMTSDDDWSTLEQFETLLEGLRRRQAHCSFYIVPRSRVTGELMEAWEKEGHSFSVHPDFTETEDPQAIFMPRMIKDNITRHTREFNRPPRTIRHHAVRWLGYVDAARLLAELGVGMDTNYLSIPIGYMTGSGRPLRFVDTDGTIIPCFQQPTLWTEECLIHPEFVFSCKWTVKQALSETEKIIRQAAEEFYTPVTFNSHPVSFATYSSPLVEGVWDMALAQGSPIISADEWLEWTEARESIRIRMETEGCMLSSPHAIDSVTVLFPGDASPQAEGNSIVSRQSMWGQDYVAVTLTDLEAGGRRMMTLER